MTVRHRQEIISKVNSSIEKNVGEYVKKFIDPDIEDIVSINTNTVSYIFHALRDSVSHLFPSSLNSLQDVMSSTVHLAHSWNISFGGFNHESNLNYVKNVLPANEIKKSFIKLKNLYIDYGYLESNIKCRILSQDKKINMIIPVRRREKYLETFIKYAQKLNTENDWCITIIFQEDEEEIYTKYLNILSEEKYNLIYLPHHVVSSEYGDNMNRSLMYNLVCRLVRSSWMINHDVDLLFDEEFIKCVNNKTEKSELQWFQPYRGSRVLRLDEESTEKIMSNDSVLNLRDFFISVPEKKKTPIEAGAPGGSLVVRRDIFLEIGGYDPEVIWGYAPEDALIWTKLEFNRFGYEKPNHLILHPFKSSDVFSHETNSELFHLHHENTLVDSRYSYWMNTFMTVIYNNSDPNFVDMWLDISKENLSRGL